MAKKENNNKNFGARAAFKAHQKEGRPKQIALAVYGDDFENANAVPVSHEWVHVKNTICL